MSTISPSDQAKALAIVATYISSRTQIKALDYQVLIPAMLVALRNSNIVVRSAAEMVIREMWKSYRAMEVDTNTRQPNIAFAGTFYGSSCGESRTSDGY